MATLMEEDVASESGSQNGLRGVDLKDPPMRKKELRRHRRARPGTPGEAHSSGYLRHERTALITTVYGLMYYGRELSDILNSR